MSVWFIGTSRENGLATFLKNNGRCFRHETSDNEQHWWMSYIECWQPIWSHYGPDEENHGQSSGVPNLSLY